MYSTRGELENELNTWKELSPESTAFDLIKEVEGYSAQKVWNNLASLQERIDTTNFDELVRAQRFKMNPMSKDDIEKEIIFKSQVIQSIIA